MRVFSTFMSWSNEKNCMRVDGIWEARVYKSFFNFNVPVTREQELHES